MPKTSILTLLLLFAAAGSCFAACAIPIPVDDDPMLLSLRNQIKPPVKASMSREVFKDDSVKAKKLVDGRVPTRLRVCSYAVSNALRIGDNLNGSPVTLPTIPHDSCADFNLNRTFVGPGCDTCTADATIDKCTCTSTKTHKVVHSKCNNQDYVYDSVFWSKYVVIKNLPGTPNGYGFARNPARLSYNHQRLSRVLVAQSETPVTVDVCMPAGVLIKVSDDAWIEKNTRQIMTSQDGCTQVTGKLIWVDEKGSTLARSVTGSYAIVSYGR